MTTTDNLNKISIISELCNKSVDAEIMNRFILKFSLSQPNVPQILSDYGFGVDDFEDTGHFRYEIDLRQFRDFSIVLDEKGLRGRANWDKGFLNQKDIIVLKFEGSYLHYEQNSKTTYINKVKKEDCFLISNLINYLSVIEYFKSSQFADYFNGVDGEVIIYSTTKGIFKLFIPSVPPKLDYKVNLENDTKQLLKKLENSEYSIHFKNKLFSLDKKLGEDQIVTLITNLDNIINEAENDHQLQLKNFSFDKLKSDLQKEKEKYFSSLREILSKILGQIVGVPISIAASTFASYKIDSVLILVLVLVAFFIYVGFAIYFQFIYFKDVEEIDKDFGKDFAKISEKSGLLEVDIENERLKIVRRIEAIKNTIKIFVGSIFLLTGLFSFYLIQQIISKCQPKMESKEQVIYKKDTLQIQVKVLYKADIERRNAQHGKKEIHK